MSVENALSTAFEPATPAPERRAAKRIPPMNLYEDDDGYLALVDLPGVPPADVDVRVEREAIHVTGEQADTTAPSTHFQRAIFSRTLAMPDGVDVDGVVASFERGVLQLNMPKLPEVKPRKIAIQAV